MIRAVVLPFGRGGMIGGSMLGLGRALGETIAVAIILSPIFTITPHLLDPAATPSRPRSRCASASRAGSRSRS